jgi:hypothetical protein
MATKTMEAEIAMWIQALKAVSCEWEGEKGAVLK